MRLLAYCYEYPPIGAGAGNALSHLAREWVSDGHHVTVVTSAYRDLPIKEISEGVEIIRLNVGRKSPTCGRIFEMARFMSASWRTAADICRAARPDLSVVFMPIPSGFGAWQLKHKYGLPMVSELRGGDVPGFDPARLRFFHNLIAPFVKRFWGDSVCVIANSEGLAQLGRKFFNGGAIHVLPNGVDTDKFCPSGQKPSTDKNFEFIFVGRFAESQKNIIALLRLLARVPGIYLTLVGDGPDRAQLKRLSKELHLEGRVKWSGWLQKEELIRALSSADAYISASRWEGMSNAVLEAMSCRLPLLLSRAAGHTELVRSGINGYLFDPDDLPGLETACRALMADSERLVRMGEESRKMTVLDHSWRSIARQRIMLYQRALQG